jgi:hypothetical protein
MNELNIIKQVVQLAFTSGKISNLDEIKTIVTAIDILESKLKTVENTNQFTNTINGNN